MPSYLQSLREDGTIVLTEDQVNAVIGSLMDRLSQEEVGSDAEPTKLGSLLDDLIYIFYSPSM